MKFLILICIAITLCHASIKPRGVAQQGKITFNNHKFPYIFVDQSNRFVKLSS